MVGAIADTSAAAQPEIQRAVGQAHAVGQLHALRNIPEACVRLQGRFTGDVFARYRLESMPRDRCATRAYYVEAQARKVPPSIATGWILNDMIRAPNSACPNQRATLSVWRHPIDPTRIAFDGQARMRMDMQGGAVATPNGQTARAISLYTATLAVGGSCP